ncbi:MAG: hypothetical protein MI919_29365, partial [Holophagales bacterium]|nr:hypothetical protein [Holophagales bacterium]
AAVLAVGLLCQAAILLPWEAWMWRQTGKLMPVSSGGRLSLLDGLTISIKPGRLGRPDLGPGTVELQQDLQAHRRQIDGPLDAAAFLGRKAREEPGPVLRLLAAKAARSWYATDSLRFERWILLLQIPYLLLAAAGTWLWVRQRAADRERVADLVTVAVFVVYFWGMTFLVLSILRYMLPAMALLMLPAGEALRRALLTSGQLLAPRLESNGGLEVPP